MYLRIVSSYTKIFCNSKFQNKKRKIICLELLYNFYYYNSHLAKPKLTLNSLGSFQPKINSRKSTRIFFITILCFSLIFQFSLFLCFFFNFSYILFFILIFNQCYLILNYFLLFLEKISFMLSAVIILTYRNIVAVVDKILVMPYSKLHYIASTLLTIIIMGLASATIILIAGLPIVAGNITIDITSVIYLVFGLVMGSVFFGSFAIILSTRLKSNEGFTVIINSVFLFFAFASSAFYPPHGLPESMQYAFYINPLTYIADIIREGMFSAVNTLTNIKVLVLTAISGITFLIATLSMYK